ncbi:MAG: HypC/HybG/HupF family hydrogenase formation chaperone [Actinomycetota bacterium]|nr:HypC/HybG/HupF family hydrogenase formation chaperone [Actinomycetota bacterium]
MCLAIPGRIVSIGEQYGQPVAMVDFGGTSQEVVLSLVPEAVVGDYVIAHAGVAIQVLDEAAAAETLALLAELGEPGRTDDPA